MQRWNGFNGTITGGCIEGNVLKNYGVERLLTFSGESKVAMLRVPMDKGEIILSQCLIKDRINSKAENYDPVAEHLLMNLLSK